MRIPSPYISNQVRPLPANPPISKPTTSSRTATDSYNKQSAKPSPQIIDAEYVEFYSPGTKIFNQELLDLDNTLASETTSNPSNPDDRFTQAVSKYQDNERHQSAPGKHLNVYT